MWYRLAVFPLPPTCLLVTVNEARSYFASTITSSSYAPCIVYINFLYRFPLLCIRHPPQLIITVVVDMAVHWNARGQDVGQKSGSTCQKHIVTRCWKEEERTAATGNFP
jgi:predicted NAD/FAD-dependent oxidoreductase